MKRFVPTAALLLLLAGASGAAGLSIESQVLGPGGKGLAGARVELWPVLRVYDRGVRELEGKQPEPTARMATEADGWFRFPVPAEGPWKVTVAAEGFPQMFFVWMVIGEETLEPVQMGSKAAEGSLGRPVPPPVPKRAAGLRPWVLKIHDRGKAVRDALIRDEESGLVIGRTGQDGTLLAEGPKTGGWDVRVETRDGRLASYSLPPIPAKMKILLPPPVALTGRVVDRATGQPVAQAQIRIYPAGPGSPDDPVVRVRTLPPGEWTVGACLEDRCAEGKIVIAPGDEKPVLDLEFHQEP